jgi:hypothetical protein
MTGIVPNGTRKKGLLGLSWDYFHVIVTNQRLIFARQTSEMMAAASQQAKADAKQEGKGFFGQWGAMLSSSFNPGQRYFTMPVEAILHEHPENFCFSAAQIRSVKFEDKRIGSDDNREEHHIIFDTGSGKINLVFNALNKKEAWKVLSQLLGDKLHKGFLDFF